jgi:hypothetical protein
LPIPSARELASLEHAGVGPGVTGRRISILHSSAGLLLCSRGHVSPVHYYVCDPLSRKWVALPELPRPPHSEQSGLLSVSAGAGAVQGIKAFQVVLFD